MSAPCLPVRHSKKRKKNGRSSADAEAETASTTFEDISTMDAAEYLARVVRQAKEMPDVFEQGVATKDDLSVSSSSNNLGRIPQHLKNHVPIDGSAASLQYLISGRASLTPPPSQNHLPKDTDGWIQNSIQNFERLKLFMEDCRSKGIGGKKTQRIPLPAMKDRDGWHFFCIGKEGLQTDDELATGAGSATNDETATEEPKWKASGVPDNGHQPTIRLLTQMDQVLVRRVVAHLSYFLCQEKVPLTAQLASWLYGLLARLEKPIHRDDASILFGLLKALTLARSKAEIDPSIGPSNPAESKLARWNLLIVLIGIYFEQGANVVMTLTSKKVS